MRNKIKQLMNKEEGFTLVELLAVIVILGIIVAIAIPAIGNVISKASGQADDAETALIVDAARLYDLDEENEIGSDSGSGVTPAVLHEKGYLEWRGEETENGTPVFPDGTVIKENGSYKWQPA